jgi:hypothetical protein
MSKNHEKPKADARSKKAYSRPYVTAYGSVVELTKGAGVSTADVGAGFQNA